MKRFSLFIQTVRYLRVSQLAYQVYYRLRRPKVRELPAPVQRKALSDWPCIAFLSPATEDGHRFSFLGQTARLEGDWNDTAFPKLWLYNLHYQDDLNARGADSRADLCAKLIDRWVEGNPPIRGNGWEPYCLSLRIVNWVKYFSRLGPDKVKVIWLESLAVQADALEQQLEFHILANHLFANAKALVFAGAYLGGEQGDRLLSRGLKLLDREIPEQFLADGAHYERSPMYQGTLLWDLADLILLSQRSRLPELVQRAGDWEKRCVAGLEWLKAMSHPDGKVSFFNDATFGIAPGVQELKEYLDFLGVSLPAKETPGDVQGRLFQPSGYAVVNWPGNHRLLIDLAPLGPDYQPGHAHADTLSCELSVFGQRVLVNSGISCYGQDAERHRQRATAAHNTVEVDGQNSSEVWSGFRVARRARPFDVSLQQQPQKVIVEGSHDGYQRLKGKVTHKRRWVASSSDLLIEDVLTGRYQEAFAWWHFHPDVRLFQTGSGHYGLVLPDGQQLDLSVEGGSVCLSEGTWHPGFGVSVPNQRLAVSPSDGKIRLRVHWSHV